MCESCLWVGVWLCTVYYLGTYLMIFVDIASSRALDPLTGTKPAELSTVYTCNATTSPKKMPRAATGTTMSNIRNGTDF